MTTSKLIVVTGGLLVVGGLLLCGRDSVPAYPRSAVAGSVTLDGELIPNATVRFVPINGTPGRKWFAPISNGKFRADSKNGPPVGKHRVEVETAADSSYAFDDEELLARMESGDKEAETKSVLIPSRYTRNSPFLVTVVAGGPNDYEFKLIDDE